jgi:hypothetical protein
MIKELKRFFFLISSNTLFIIAYNIINDVALPLTINCGGVIVFFNKFSFWSHFFFAQLKSTQLHVFFKEKVEFKDKSLEWKS